MTAGGGKASGPITASPVALNVLETDVARSSFSMGGMTAVGTTDEIEDGPHGMSSAETLTSISLTSSMTRVPPS